MDNRALVTALDGHFTLHDRLLRTLSRVPPSSERDFVVEVGVAAAAPAAARRAGSGARRLAVAAGAITLVIAALARPGALAAAAGAVEHRQLAAEALQYHLRRITPLVLLVGPFSRL